MVQFTIKQIENTQQWQKNARNKHLIIVFLSLFVIY